MEHGELRIDNDPSEVFIALLNLKSQIPNLNSPIFCLINGNTLSQKRTKYEMLAR
jgi:hypothetical protein